MRITTLISLALFILVGTVSIAGEPPATGSRAVEDGLRPARKSDDLRPNVLLITVDDMNWDSLGVTGCRVPDISPHIDQLARDGMRFENAFVTVAVCQPCREILMTGRYAHRNGAMGFKPIDPDIPTLQESLRAAGYTNGILGKVPHLAPQNKFCWDYVKDMPDLGEGRAPSLYHDYAVEFFQQAKAAGKPFFLMANSHDPHRPFPASEPREMVRELLAKRNVSEHHRNRVENAICAEVTRRYTPEEAEVPGFLPDIPAVRKEIAQYFTAVHRADETTGAVLQALDACGLREKTLVMWLSDHGMPFPFAKTNCYLNSTKTPWIVRWPKKVTPGQVDTEHFISGIDFMPTILEATGCKQVDGMDGTSFLPVLLGGSQPQRDHVFTAFHQTAGRNDYPMRNVMNKRYAYIYNAWSDGEMKFLNESQAGLTMAAMVAASKHDPEVAARVQLFWYRVPEEFYDLQEDPDALENLIDVPKHQEVLNEMRKQLLEMMTSSGDPLTNTFRAFLQKDGA